MKRTCLLLVLLFSFSNFAFADYPLTMTAVYTRGQSAVLHDPKEMFHSGDYDCTRGDANNAPECHTLLEWAEMEAIAGTPDTVVFTLADGSQVGVQTHTMNKIPGFLECAPYSEIIFCSLYFEFLTRQQQVPRERVNKYGQTESLSTQEMIAAEEARRKELFGDGNTMTLTFRYRLKGGPKDHFQKIEIDRSSCTEEHGVNHCSSIPEALNARANGYFVGDKVDAPQLARKPAAGTASAPAIAPAAGTPPDLETLKQNSQAARTSDAAAAAMANAGHVQTPQELAQLLATGQASRCAVLTNPAGAEIYIDGNKGGVTPLVFVLIKHGDTPRTLTIKKAGYKTVERQLVPDGRNIPISVVLEKETP